MGVEPKIGENPQNGWFINNGKTLFKWMIWEFPPIFGNIHHIPNPNFIHDFFGTKIPPNYDRF